MRKEHRRGIVFQCFRKYLPRFEQTSVECSFVKAFRHDQPQFQIKKRGMNLFVLKMAHSVGKESYRGTGCIKNGFWYILLLIHPAREFCGTDKLDRFYPSYPTDAHQVFQPDVEQTVDAAICAVEPEYLTCKLG